MVYQKSIVSGGTSDSPTSVIERGGLKSLFSRFNFTKSILFILIAFFTLLLLSGSAMAATIYIDTPAQFSWIGDGSIHVDARGTSHTWTMADIYILDDDITINTDWASLGASGSPFTGVFDGNGNTITFGNGVTTELNFTPDAATGPVGLFGYAQGATFQNLNIIVNNTTLNFTPAGASDGSGILVGKGVAGGTITFDNCHVEFVGPNASVVSTQMFIGNLIGLGRIGTDDVVITDCTVIGGSITGLAFVGGLAGSTTNVSIIDSNVATNVSSTATTVVSIGGFIGQTYGNFTTLTGSNFTGNISTGPSTTGVAGGLIGAVTSIKVTAGTTNNTVTITDCHVVDSTMTSLGPIIGGFIGRTNITSTSDPVWSQVTITDSTVRNSSIEGNYRLGGFVGHSENAVLVMSGSSFEGNIRAYCDPSKGMASGGAATSKIAGGLVGQAEVVDISNCYVVGNISAYGRSGGLIGFLGGTNTHNSIMEKCYFEGNLSCYGDYNPNVLFPEEGEAGGLIGLYTESVGLSISECYTTGLIESNLGRAGGLIGLVGANLSIDDSYSTCSVYGYNGVPSEPLSGLYAGGLIGAVFADKSANTRDIYVNNSYAAGSMVFAGSSMAGGLIGSICADQILLPGSYVQPIVHIKDSYSLVSNVSSLSKAGPVIGEYDPAGPAAASTFSNIRVWVGMGGHNSSQFASPVISVARNDVYNTYPTNWSTFSNSIWEASTSAYGLPIFKAPGMDSQPSGINPMVDINKGSSNNGGNKGPGATISNNTTNTTQNPPVYTPPTNGDSNLEGSDATNGSSHDGPGTTNLGTDSGNNTNNSGVFGGIKTWFGNHSILGYGGLIIVAVIIAGAAVYFVKFRGKDY
jgi:hypothetical protein